MADIGGKPRVVDGDTLAFGPQLVRLYGVDAPELNQTCVKDGEHWPCGQEAGFALSLETAYQWIVCDEVGEDDYGRILGQCFMGGVGGPYLNPRVVESGWAVADRRYTDEFVAEEEIARAHGRGIWSSTFLMPWDWLKGRRLKDER